MINIIIIISYLYSTINFCQSSKLHIVADDNRDIIKNAVNQSFNFFTEIILHKSDWLKNGNFCDISSQCKNPFNDADDFIIVLDEKNDLTNKLNYMNNIIFINNNLKSAENTISVVTPNQLIVMYINHLIPFFNITNRIIILGSEYIEYKQLINYQSDITGIGSQDFHSIGKTIKTLKKNYTDFIVVGSLKQINNFIENFYQNNMFHYPFRIFVMSNGKGKIKCISCLHATLYVIQPLPCILHEYERPPLKNVNPENVITSYFYYDLYSLAFISLDECRGKNLQETMANLTYDYNGKYGEFIFTDQINYQDILYRIYKHIYRTNVKITTVGDLTMNNIVHNQALQEVEFYVCYVKHAPFFMEISSNSSNPEDEDGIKYGFMIDLFEEIKKRMDFPPFKWKNVEQYGYTPVPKEEEDVMEQEICSECFFTSDNCNLGLMATSVTEDRMEKFDFTEPIFDIVGMGILMKKPIRESKTWKFITVLEFNVWLCICAAYFFNSFLLALFERYSSYSYRNNKEKYKNDPETRDFTLKESLWFSITSLTPQGGGEAPKSTSGRLIAATWWLFGFIIIASYTSNLAAFLTVSRLESHIGNLNELAKQYKIRYNTGPQTAFKSYFDKMQRIEEKYYEIWKDMSLNDSITEDERAQLAVWDYPVSDKYTKIWSQMQEAESKIENSEALKKVKDSTSDSGFAFITDVLTIDYLTYLYCDVYRVGEEFSLRPFAMPIIKTESELKKKLNKVIIQLKNEGIIDDIKAKYWENNPSRKKCDEHRKLNDGLSLENTGGSFVVIAVGILATFIVLSIENCIITRWLKKKHTQAIKKSSKDK